MYIRNNFSGVRFGKLVGIKPVGRNKDRRVIWEFRCDCGKHISLTGKDVLYNKKTSCGCDKGKLAIQKNKVRIEGDIVFVLVGDHGEEMICDLVDWEKLKIAKWFISTGGYVKGHLNGKIINFSRAVLSPPENFQVDHINRNKLDNRKTNLRMVSQFENSLNKNIRIDNSSGVTGISWDRKNKKWKVQITKDGRNFWIGRFFSLEEAKKARKIAETEYFGECLKMIHPGPEVAR